MAERLHDVTDLLHAAESDLARLSGDVGTDEVLRRTHRALRVARTRRAALAVAGAAAAVAAVVVGGVVWRPGPDAQPARPDPSPEVTLSTSAAVPGLPPLRQATEEEVRDAPEGSALVLWAQSTQRQVELRRLVPLAHDPYLLLVLPDGEVLQVSRVAQGTEMLMSWDRASATAEVVWFDGPVIRGEDASGSWEQRQRQELRVVDVLTGRVAGTPDERLVPPPSLSPDGTREADQYRVEDGARIRVVTPDGEWDHPEPADGCIVRAWADDARLLLTCPSSTPEARSTDGRPRFRMLLMDAATGDVVEERPLHPDEGTPGWPVRTDDGRLVVPLVLDGGPVGPLAGGLAPTCRTRLAALDGLDLTPLGEVPAGSLHGIASAPGGRVLLYGSPGCYQSRPGIWSLEVASGAADVLLPPPDAADEPMGVLGWVTWR